MEEKVKETVAPLAMSVEDLLTCSPTVLGFSFGDKMWAEFAVEHIHEIVFNPEAFNSLVLPENQKTIVRALVESQDGKMESVSGKKKPGIGDIVENKGRGMVAVLHGRPGVGKTLTAEGMEAFSQLVRGDADRLQEYQSTSRDPCTWLLPASSARTHGRSR